MRTLLLSLSLATVGSQAFAQQAAPASAPASSPVVAAPVAAPAPAAAPAAAPATTKVGGEFRALWRAWDDTSLPSSNHQAFDLGRARVVISKAKGDAEAVLQLRFESPQNGKGTSVTCAGTPAKCTTDYNGILENVNRAYVTVKNVVPNFNLSLGKFLYPIGETSDLGLDSTRAYNHAGLVDTAYGFGALFNYKLPDLVTFNLAVTNGNGRAWTDNNGQKLGLLAVDITPIGKGLNVRAGYAVNVPGTTKEVAVTGYTGDVKNVVNSWAQAGVTVGQELIVPGATVMADFYFNSANDKVKSTDLKTLAATNKTAFDLRGSYKLDMMMISAGYNYISTTLPEKVAVSKGVFGKTINWKTTATANDKKADSLTGSEVILDAAYLVDEARLGLEYRMQKSDKLEFVKKVDKNNVPEGKDLSNTVTVYAQYNL